MRAGAKCGYYKSCMEVGGLKRVTGIGGIFFKSNDQEKLHQWYEKHLGITRAPDGTGATFEWRDLDHAKNKGMTVWAVFPGESKYFDPSHSPFMINYRVDDLDPLLRVLKEEGVEIDPHREDYDYGRFAWTAKDNPDCNPI